MTRAALLLLGTFLAAATPAAAKRPAAERALYAIGAELVGLQTLTAPERRWDLYQKQRWDLYDALGELARKLDLFELQFGRPPQDVYGWQILRRTARKLLKTRRWDDDERDLLMRGTLLELAGRPQAAERDYARALWRIRWSCHIDIRLLAQVRLQRSSLRQRQGRYAEALPDLELALRYTGALDITLCRRAVLLRRTGKPGAARAQLQRVVDVFPGSAGAKVARAKLGAHLQRGPVARRLIAAVVSQRPERWDALLRFKQLVPEAASIQGTSSRSRTRELLKRALRRHRRAQRKKLVTRR